MPAKTETSVRSTTSAGAPSPGAPAIESACAGGGAGAAPRGPGDGLLDEADAAGRDHEAADAQPERARDLDVDGATDVDAEERRRARSGMRPGEVRAGRGLVDVDLAARDRRS